MKNLLNTLKETIKNNNLNEDEVLNAIFIKILINRIIII